MSVEKNQFNKQDFDIIIVGGGLGGLTAAILLSKAGKKVLLIEKKTYPFHKVCGEYVSNEVLPFLKSLGFDPFKYGASAISKLRVSTPSGKNIHATLDLGGFGLSRYTMDNALFELSQMSGAKSLTGVKVKDITFHENYFKVEIHTGEIFSAKLVIGSYGKRSMLDKKLNRDFIQTHTGYLGVKYHIRADYPVDEVGLDNFEDGYCGIVKIEEDKYNLCYLYKRSEGVNFKSTLELEENILFKNPVIKNIFQNAKFLTQDPEVINEISFAPKKLVENHVLMCGDSAGLITPLCGNGMAMAIHSAKLLSELIIESRILTNQEISDQYRERLEKNYEKAWKENFSRRLYWGRNLQKIFGNEKVTSFGLKFIHAVPPLERWMIKQTHGEEISV